MKLEIQTEQFLSAVSTAARFVERRPNLPVLSCILLSAQNGSVVLRATNLECGVEISVPAKVLEDGVVAVPGVVLSGFLGNARGKTCTVSIIGGVCKVESDRSSASIKIIPYEDFPLLPKVSATNSFSVKVQDLIRAIRSVVYCASVSAIKPELQSVLLYAEAGKLVTVATDSFRLAERTVPLQGGGSVPQLLLPARNASELVRILDSASGSVDVYYNENQISIQVESMYYTSRLLDGTFPNYRQIIPKEFSTEAIVLREDFNSALKSLSLFVDKFAQVSLVIDQKKKELTLSSRNPDVGEQVSNLQATVLGEPVSISFNGKYLADSLQSINGDSVRLHSNGAGKPMLIKDASDESFFYLAMPMNR